MAKQSAGLLVYRLKNGQVEVLLGHAGGPFWGKKDKGAWTIPKGEFKEGEEPLQAAHREFEEELGQPSPKGQLIELGSVKMPGKVNFVWAIEGDLDVLQVQSNTYKMEWPPRSGQIQEFPEVDRAAWVAITKAPEKLHRGQNEFIVRLIDHLLQTRPELANSIKPPEQASLF